MLNKTKFCETMTGIAGMLQVNLTEWMLDTYYNIFKDYTYEQFDKAILEVLKTLKYHTFPKPAEILEFLEGTRDDKALGAWLQVLEAVNKGGYYASIEFKDPIISHCIVDLGGWMAFCSSQKEELPFMQKRFMDLYRLYLKRGIEKSLRLIGFFELKNYERGYLEDIPKPVRIGLEEDIQKQIENKAQCICVK